MAPQQPAKTKTPEQLATEARDRAIENDEAHIGTAEDGARSTRTERANQNNEDIDPLGGGVEARRQIERPTTPNDVRANIAARFRRTTPENERPFDGDMTHPENTIGEVGQNLEGARDPDEDDDLEQEAIRRAQAAELGDIEGLIDEELDVDTSAAQPQRRSIGKVRGQEVFMTDDEILEAARKIKAGDSYLEETRKLLEEAKRIRAGAAQARSPTGEQTGTDELDEPLLDDDASSTGPSYKDVVEKIQFGDPEEAAQQLETLVKNQANKVSQEGQLQRSFNQDFQRSQKALASFRKANPELEGDEFAAMAIEHNMYKLYAEDMKSLGLSDDQIPKDRNTLANWHRFYRINGYEVRPTSELLTASKDNFLKWRGGQAGDGGQQRPRKAPANIQVSVNRDQRRQAIPLQPSRSSTIRQAPAAAPPGDRSSVVAQMRRSRGQV